MAGEIPNPGDQYILEKRPDLFDEITAIAKLMTQLGELFAHLHSASSTPEQIRNKTKEIYNATNAFLLKHNDSQNSNIGKSTIDSFKKIITVLKDIRLNFKYTPNNSSIDIDAIHSNVNRLTRPLLKGLRNFIADAYKSPSKIQLLSRELLPVSPPQPPAPQKPLPPSAVAIAPAPATPPQPPAASAAAGTPPLARLPKIPTPLPGALSTVNETNENNENSNNNNENNTQLPMTSPITESQIAPNIGRLPISASPYFSYNSNIIKVNNRLGNTTTYKVLSDDNIWGEEQTRDIPDTELTPIVCPPTTVGGKRRKTVRAKAKGKGKGNGRAKARPTRRHRKRA